MTIAAARRLGGEFFWVTTGQALAAVGGLVGVRLMTGALTPREYGELALATTAAMFAQQAILSPLSGGMLRYFSAAGEASALAPFFRASSTLLAQATLILSALFASILAALWFAGAAHFIPLALMAFVFALSSGYAMLLDGIQNAARQRLVVAWHAGLNQWLRFLIAFALCVTVAATSTIAMTGYTIGSVIVLASQWMFFRRRVAVAGSPDAPPAAEDRNVWRKRISEYAWPIGLWGVFYWFQAASDRWALEMFRTTDEVGRYSVLYQLGYYPVILLNQVLLQLLSPIIFQRAGAGTDRERVRASHRITSKIALSNLSLTIVGVLLAWLLHPFLFRLLAAPEYRSVSPLLPLMVLSAGIFSTGQIISLALMTEGRTRDLLAPRIATAFAGVAANLAAARAFGTGGVVWAGIAVAAVFTIWAFLLIRRDPDILRDEQP